MNAPCTGRGDLFASGHPADHEQAKQYCAVCPAAQFATCARIRDDILASYGGHIEGTWAGQHYGGVRRYQVSAA